MSGGPLKVWAGGSIFKAKSLLPVPFPHLNLLRLLYANNLLKNNRRYYNKSRVLIG